VWTARVARWKGAAGVTDNQDSALVWQKSSASGATNCVEVAFVQGWVLIRDSANPEDDMLRFSRAAWNSFLTEVRNADFNLH
jgi:hypothetical protein